MLFGSNLFYHVYYIFFNPLLFWFIVLYFIWMAYYFISSMEPKPTVELIAHNLSILLMNSNCFASYFFSCILVMSVQISILYFISFFFIYYPCFSFYFSVFCSFCCIPFNFTSFSSVFLYFFSSYRGTILKAFLFYQKHSAA